ncbi:unnamed protein product [Orchesella dallaii]|uniref:EFHB C-terminal EF-hand domain-containing protein n=1 Tax=Orchesella dallaii TaxID=48710 RepID=A0ABP1Q9Z3_9HEXA
MVVTAEDCRCPDPKVRPLIPIAYPNENRSHVQVQPVEGTPGVDPCCKPSQYPCFDESFSKCKPIACTAGAHDPTAAGSCYDSTSIHQRQCECPKCAQELHKFQEDGRVCYQHTDGNQFHDIRRIHPDPEIQAIRDRLNSSESVKNTLRWCNTDESLSCVDRRFRQAQTGITGQAGIHYGAAQDVDYPRELIHGVLSDEVTPATHLVNPPPKKWVDQLLINVQESIYESNRVRPIGKSHDQKERLPPTIHPDETAFGKPSDKSISASILVNPPKDRFQVENEAKEFQPLYKFTHGDYEAGEQLCRNYVANNYSKHNTFGMKTPHDVAGRWARKIISTWRSCDPDPAYVSKIYADHLDFRYPKLGKQRDATCVGRDRGDEFVYGKKTTKDEEQRPAQELIFNRCPNPGGDKAQKMMSNLKTWIEKVRKACKDALGPDLEKFYEEIISADPNCDGTIEWDPFIKAMQIQHIPRTLSEKDFMECLAYVGVFHPCPCDKLEYYKLMDLIKGYEDPMFGCKTTTLKPYYLPHTNGCVHFRTSYSDHTSNMCVPPNCLTTMKEQRVNGMPSVRYDRLPRKIKSTKDTTNYGDDGDAYSLIFPSVYTSQGITIRDAFKEMTKEQMCRLLCLANVPLTHEQINRTWEAAKCLDPDGCERVSYQTFREALCQVCDEMATEQGCPAVYSLQPSDCPPFYPKYPKPHLKPNPCAGVDP